MAPRRWRRRLTASSFAVTPKMAQPMRIDGSQEWKKAATICSPGMPGMLLLWHRSAATPRLHSLAHSSRSALACLESKVRKIYKKPRLHCATQDSRRGERGAVRRGSRRLQSWRKGKIRQESVRNLCKFSINFNRKKSLLFVFWFSNVFFQCRQGA